VWWLRLGIRVERITPGHPEQNGRHEGMHEQVEDKIWLVSFMPYDLGLFDHDTGRLESVQNPFEARVLPMSPV
jgi:hypothetical protein